MAYAILRFAKHKGGASKALSAHHERTKEVYDSNPDIDPSRTAQNIHLVTPLWSYEQEIKHRIQTAGCRVRKDSVKFVDTLVTVSPEFAKTHAAHGFRSRDGDSPFPCFTSYDKGDILWHTLFYDLQNTRAARPRR